MNGMQKTRAGLKMQARVHTLLVYSVLTDNNCFAEGRGFAPAGATKGLSDRPLETFGAVPFLLCFYCSAVLAIP